MRYFEQHQLPLDWAGFLDDFQAHWPTDDSYTYVDFVREGICGNGAARLGNRRWRRLTEVRAGAAKSVSFRCAGGSRQVNPRRVALVASSAASDGWACSLLAFRWLEYRCWTVGSS
jgi:hypothetical protein